MTIRERLAAPFRRRSGAALAAPRPAGGIDVDTNPGIYGNATLGGSLANRLEPAVRSWASATDLTPSVVRAMRRHFQVASCLQVQSLPITQADWTIECDDDDVREVVTTVYGYIAAQLHESAARSLAWGYSPNTLTWNVDPVTGALCATYLRDLEPSSCKPLIEADGTYAGIRQEIGGRKPVDVDDPRLTLWIVEGMESGNLYGRSILEAAREPWTDWQLYRLFHARYLERFGEPVVRGRAPSGSTVVNQDEINAATLAKLTDPTVVIPAPIRQGNLEVIEGVGENLRHHSVVTLPSDLQYDAQGKAIGHAWELDYLEPTRSGGADFREALRESERGMARGIFVPDLLLSNTESGSYSLGEEHKDVWTLGVEGRNRKIARQVSQHYLDDVVTLNFGESAPRARLKFAPLGDESTENLWTLALELAKGGLMPVEVVQLAERLGVPLAAQDDGVDDVAAAASSPFTNVGLPALIAAGVITETEARALIGISGEAPGKPAGADPAALTAQRDAIRADLGLGRERIALAAGDPPPMREPNDREAAVDWQAVEADLNAAQADADTAAAAALSAAAARVLRQVAGIMRRGGTTAEVVEALGTLEVGALTGPLASAWSTMMGGVWSTGLRSVADELPEYADKVPEAPGRDGKALIKALTAASAARYAAELTTRVQLEAIAAHRSGLSAQGVSATVTELFDAEVRGDRTPVTRTSQHLLAKALNEGRADAIERAGIPLAGAQFSAILDRVTCELCRRLDETTISVKHTDFARFTPPLHHNCRCVWVFVVAGEVDFVPTWKTPPSSLVDANGGLVLG